MTGGPDVTPSGPLVAQAHTLRAGPSCFGRRERPGAEAIVLLFVP